ETGIKALSGLRFPWASAWDDAVASESCAGRKVAPDPFGCSNPNCSPVNPCNAKTQLASVTSSCRYFKDCTAFCTVQPALNNLFFARARGSRVGCRRDSLI